MAQTQPQVSQQTNKRASLGSLGETIAASYAQDRGYRILARNWRCSFGEIDLIIANATTVVAVEVKTRSGSGYGAPLEAITPRKRARLRRLFAEWLRQHPSDVRNVRIDGIGITLKGREVWHIEHIEGIQ